MQPLKSELIEKITEEELVTQILRSKYLLDDLFEFNRRVLRVEEGPGRVSLAPFHRELCDFVQKWEKKRRKLILLPRGHLKSTLVTVGYTLQQIAKNPKIRILIANATHPMAVSFLSQIKDHLVKNSRFIEMYGDLADKTLREKWTESMIKIVTDAASYERKEPTVTSFGMGGNLVSQHYDLIILDDLVNRENIGTREQIEKVITTYRDILDLLEPTGHLICIGTVWHDADLYNWILGRESREKEFFDIMIKRAVEGNLNDGEVLFPEKYSRAYLKQLLAEKGPYQFSCQYLNQAVPDEKATFRSDWFRYYIDDDIKGRPMNYFTFIDPAISGAKTADYTTFVTVGVDAYSNIWIIDIIREHFNPTELINEMFLVYDKFRPRQMCIETVAFQKALQHFIYSEMKDRRITLPILEVKPDFRESKEMRIRGLVPYYAAGKVYHPQYGFNMEFLEDELTRFPVGKYDDIIDALSYAPKVIYPAKVKMEDEDRSRRNRYLY